MSSTGLRGGSLPPEGADESVVGLLRYQSRACGSVGSPLYRDLLARAADDFEAAGPTARVLAGHEHDPVGSALALRLMGAAHRLALDGSAAELAAVYASTAPRAERAWAAFRALLEERSDDLRGLLEHPVQTNEVGRCAALLLGFFDVARETGLPLSLLEVGASAGLNLRWPAYRYEADGLRWGPPDSPVRIGFELRGGAVPQPPDGVAVAEARGCDPAPIDPRVEEGRLTLLSYVWPDQRERLARTRAALSLAAEQPVEVDEAGAVEWIGGRLADRRSGVATVVFHSVVMQYLSEPERIEFEQALAAAGEGATPSSPLAWLRMEPDGDRAEVRLTSWPGGRDRRLARAGYHGTPVEPA